MPHKILNGERTKDGSDRMRTNPEYGVKLMASDNDTNNILSKEGKIGGTNRKGNRNNHAKGGNKRNSNGGVNPGEPTDESTNAGNTFSPTTTNSVKGKKDRKAGITQNSLDDVNKSSNMSGDAMSSLVDPFVVELYKNFEKEEVPGMQATNTNDANDSKTSSRTKRKKKNQNNSNNNSRNNTNNNR